MMSAGSVREVYAGIRERVGQQTLVPLGVISATDFQRFATAVGDGNPVYFDDAAARAAGYESVIAPPTFLSAVMAWGPGPALSEIKPDGTGPDQLGSVPMGDLRLMGAGQELEFLSPVTAGQNITMRVGVEDVTMKEGKSGEFLILTLRREYVTSDGTLIAVCSENFIGR